MNKFKNNDCVNHRDGREGHVQYVLNGGIHYNVKWVDGTTSAMVMEDDLAGKELENYRAWLAAHECEFWDRDKPKLNEHGFPRGGAIGGVFSYQFTSTGLGDAVVVRCACGHEENVTDFESW